MKDRLKRAIKTALDRRGYAIHRKTAAPESRTAAPESSTAAPELSTAAPELSYTPVEVFPLAVADLISRKKDVFFIQIGAHDGLTYDPLRLFVERYHWRGILVEPQPKIFARLVENYKGIDSLIFENVAVASQEGTMTLYTFAENSNLPAHATMLASFKKEALLYNGHGYKGEIVETRVPTVPVEALLKKHNVTEVDILQIDTEGFDYEVIKMFDLSKLKPFIISYESILLSAADRRSCEELLSSHGYRLAVGDIDTIAVLQRDYRESLLPGLHEAMAVPAVKLANDQSG
jgi:FkbM family methyltransferase